MKTLLSPLAWELLKFSETEEFANQYGYYRARIKRFIVDGVYDPEKSARVWRRFVDQVGKVYATRYLRGQAIPLETRKALAAHLTEWCYENVTNELRTEGVEAAR